MTQQITSTLIPVYVTLPYWSDRSASSWAEFIQHWLPAYKHRRSDRRFPRYIGAWKETVVYGLWLRFMGRKPSRAQQLIRPRHRKAENRFRKGALSLTHRVGCVSEKELFAPTSSTKGPPSPDSCGKRSRHPSQRLGKAESPHIQIERKATCRHYPAHAIEI